jgi:putative GTP pyrophosphokinase
MTDSEVLRRFLEEYQNYVKEFLIPAHREIKSILKSWRDPAYWSKYTKASRMPAPSPIQRIRCRIKRPESVVDKILRKPKNYPRGLNKDSFYSMNDTIGARIIVYFLSDLPLIDKEIRENPCIEISPTERPVAYLTQELIDRLSLTHLSKLQKDSGYASIHYTIRIVGGYVSKGKSPWFELQLRTLIEDGWSEIEHILGYKPNKKTTFAVKKQFQIIGTMLTAIDEHFNLIAGELSRFQEENIFDDLSVLNAENLPAVLSLLGIGCAQKEVDGLLKILSSRNLNTVSDLKRIATATNLEIISNTIRNKVARAPINFEIVASLAAITGAHDHTQIIESTKAQIEFLMAWDKLRADL